MNIIVYKNVNSMWNLLGWYDVCKLASLSWNPRGLMWNPHGLSRFCVVHVDSVLSMWILCCPCGFRISPCGFHVVHAGPCVTPEEV